MSLDGQSVAAIKNVVEKTQLNSQLLRIERQQKAEMRMDNTSKQRFKAKYARLDEYISDGVIEAPNVRLYETHNPGFCYRRNGERRTLQGINSNSTDSQDLHSLLFTDGEVDVEKVLCLHLLTAHKTETLTPPSRNNRAISFLSKEQSPLERLIERSRKKHASDNLTKLLPTYVLDVTSKARNEDGSPKKSDIVIRDGRLAERVIINDKIVQLVHTVMAALQNSNPQKMRELLAMGKNSDILKDILAKPHIKDFLKDLSGQSLLSSCESFHLTQPFKAVTVALQIETKNNNLENLVKQIRKDVLQLPNQSTWKNMYFKNLNPGQVNSDASLKETLRPTKKPPTKDTSSSVSGNENLLSDVQPMRMLKKNFIMRNKEALSKMKNSRKRSAGQSSSVQKKIITRQMGTKISSISKGNSNSSSSMAAKIRKISMKDRTGRFMEEDVKHSNDDVSGYSNLFKSMDIKTLATMISRKAKESHKRDLEEMNKGFSSDSDNEKKDSDKAEATPKEPKQEKVLITKMNCTACRERWKIPLPKPKIPTTKKFVVPTIEQVGHMMYKSGSSQKLSTMIEQEMNKVREDAKKDFPKRTVTYFKNNRLSPVTKWSSLSKKSSANTLDMTAMDLAWLNQHIREIETKKKLKKFLNSTV